MANREPINGPTKARESGQRAQDRFAALFSGLTRSKTRRYTMEVKDAESGKVVMFTAVDWTSTQMRAGIAEVCKVAGLPEDNEFIETGKR